MAAKKTTSKTKARGGVKDAPTTTNKRAVKTMTTDLLRRICAEPSNIEDRLVYADQLGERGDPRGEFISQGCAIANVDVLDERCAPMLASLARLEAKHAKRWLAEVFARVKVNPTHFARVELDDRLNAVFERGFLKRIAMNPSDLPNHWAWLAEREPIEGVEVLVGEGLDPSDRAIKAPPQLRALKVSPDGWFTAHSVGSIFSWGLNDVRDLDLSRCDLGVAGCQLLANIDVDMSSFEGWVTPPPFGVGQIKRLILRTCQIGDRGACVLFEADSLDGIQELDLAQCRLREKATLEALRHAPRMRAIERLSLSGNNDLEGAIDALAGWEALPRLTALALPQAVSAKEVEALFPSPSKALRELDLSSAKALLVTPSAIQIAEALSHLDIGTTSSGDASFASLLKMAMVERLLVLKANGCSLSDKAVDALCSSNLRRLVHLDLSSNKLTDAALARLGDWPGLEHVTHLRLGNNRKLSSAGYEALMKSPRFAPAVLDVGKQSDAKLVTRLREQYGDETIRAR